jgi:D-xylose transport system permease protein
MSSVLTEVDPRLAVDQPGLAGAWATLRRRVSQGELGSLPVIVGLIVIWAIFESQNQNFLTPRNLTNLVLQIAAMGLISAGLVLVLLLGEIDLSAGSVSGLCAAVMAVLNTRNGQSAPVAILSGLVVGAIIGLIQGFWFTRFRVPSFVVTLAGLLAWQGALLQVLGSTGTVNLTDRGITGLANTFLPNWLGWALGIGAALLLLAGICFFNFLFLAIDTLLPRWGWVAALVVTLVFAIVGGLLANKGKDQVKVQPLARTRETLKEDAEWAKHRLTPNGKSSPSETTSLQPSGS